MRCLSARWILAAALLAGTVAAAAPRGDDWRAVAPGVGYREVRVATSHGEVTGHLLTVDLTRRPGALRLLWSGAVTERETVPELARAAGAVAAVNGDFFDISEQQHPGVPATGAPVGPMMVDGQAVKAAVPQGQRFGWAIAPADSDRDVLGVDRTGLPLLDRLTLHGTLTLPGGDLPLDGLNQYALAENGIGAYTTAWGAVSRERAVCGTDADRAAPCTAQVWEATLRNGRVISSGPRAGQGPIPAHTVVLLGREAGAKRLRALAVGARVEVRCTLDSPDDAHLRWALGAEPMVVDGRVVPDLESDIADPRTAIAFDRTRHRLWLFATDGREADSTGLTITELAQEMADLGAWDAVYLDGGGSTTMTIDGRTVNTLAPQGPRAVPNAIGVL